MFQHIGGLISLSCNGSGQENDSTKVTSGSNSSDMSKFSMKLATLTHSINYKLSDLLNSNVSFENYFEEAMKSRANGDPGNDARYTLLARRERLSIRNNMLSLQQDINQRDVLAAHAKSLFTDSSFHKFSRVTQEQVEAFNISHTHVTNAI
jgi:hypothetical protein